MDENNLDMLKMIEKAMELKKIFDNNEQEPLGEGLQAQTDLSGGQSENQNKDFDILKMAQFVDLLKSLSNNTAAKEGDGARAAKEEIGEGLTRPAIKRGKYKENIFFDDDIITPQIKSIKAVVPFLDYEKQRLVAFAVKLVETKKVFDYYGQPEIKATITSQSLTGNSEVFSAVKPYLDTEKKYLIEMIEKVFELKDVMDKYKSINNEI
ncbi:MAG: hypothetical protein LBV08_08045 [Clostridiales bacterium]|nr:hypothetical protein [Clostridiales bacterium]